MKDHLDTELRHRVLRSYIDAVELDSGVDLDDPDEFSAGLNLDLVFLAVRYLIDEYLGSKVEGLDLLDIHWDIFDSDSEDGLGDCLISLKRAAPLAGSITKPTREFFASLGIACYKHHCVVRIS